MYAFFYLYNFIVSFVNSKKIYYFITLPLFILIFGFRYQIGYDWGAYEHYFYNFENYPNKFELGYHIINVLIRLLTDNFQYLVLFTFIFTTLSYFNSIKYFTPNYNIAIMAWIGIGFLSFGVIRQAIAVAIFLYSLKFVNNKKIYFCIIILATLFHKSALILFPLVFFISKNHTTKQSITFISLALLIYVFNGDDIILGLLQYVPIIGGKIGYYFNDTGAFGADLGLGVRFLEAMMLYILTTLFKPLLEKKYKYFNIFYNLLILYLFFYLSFNGTATIASRVTKYFELGHIMLFSYLVGIVKDKNLKFIFILCLFIYFGLRYYMTITGGLSLQSNSIFFLPYQNYLYNLL